MEPENLYRQLGRIIEAMPDLTSRPLAEDAYQWLARAYALVCEVNNSIDPISFKSNMDYLGSPLDINGAHQIKSILYRAFSLVEAKVPAGVSGSFIPVGSSFDAFAALSKVLKTATKDVLIVDPYMDETVLTEFSSAVAEKVNLRLMSDEASYKSTLHPAALKWSQQYAANRPVSLRLAPPKTLHDRAIFIDKKTAWTLTQSLKDFAKRSPAEIVRADDTAALKISAYEASWASAKVLL